MSAPTASSRVHPGLERRGEPSRPFSKSFTPAAGRRRARGRRRIDRQHRRGRARAMVRRCCSFGENRGLQSRVAAGYEYARTRWLRALWAGGRRRPAPGPPELRRLLERVRSDVCDVAVGSRFASDESLPAYRYASSRAEAPRGLRCSAARSATRFSGRSSTRRAACTPPTPKLFRSSPSRTRAAPPRCRRCCGCIAAGLRVDEVPVEMRERASGESKLRGKTAVPPRAHGRRDARRRRLSAGSLMPRSGRIVAVLGFSRDGNWASSRLARRLAHAETIAQGARAVVLSAGRAAMHPRARRS